MANRVGCLSCCAKFHTINQSSKGFFQFAICVHKWNATNLTYMLWNYVHEFSCVANNRE